MTGVGRFSGVALECRDPLALAEFYHQLTGWAIVYTSPEWVSLGESPDAAWHLSFQLAPGHVPPHWPDPRSSMQYHLHLRVDELDRAEAAAVALGAARFADQPNEGSRVLADPAGHPFCLVGRP